MDFWRSAFEIIIVLKNLVNLKKNKKNSNNKVFNILLFKEQFKYLKTTHSYHLVDPSPWPLVAVLGAFMFTIDGVLYMHRFIGGQSLFFTGFLLILYVMYAWWRDIIREATFEDQHIEKTCVRHYEKGILFLGYNIYGNYGFNVKWRKGKS